MNQLEVLFLLYEQSEKKWTPESVCKELRSNVSSAGIQLIYLCKCGFILSEKENEYQFDKSEPLASVVKRLHDEYQAKPVAMISYIYERPQNKLKEFADAFKLKKDS